MGDIININSIHDYNEFLGIETLNPLVTFIDFKDVKVLKHKKKLYGFYGIYLKEKIHGKLTYGRSQYDYQEGTLVFVKEKIHGKLTYGRSQYDYQEGTLVFVAPGQVAGIDDGGETPNPEGYCLLFHPDLLRGTSLAKKMKEYTFFSYEVNEALHMSERERQTIFNCFTEIEEELHHRIDKHSHCLRFYDRQFATREAINRDVLTRFEELMTGYFDSDKPEQIGLPSVAWCADQLHFSANYFGDLVKKETGKSAIEYIHLTVINRVKDLLASTNKTVSEIAYEVGFQYPHHLSRMFKKVAGCTPNEYRSAI